MSRVQQIASGNRELDVAERKPRQPHIQFRIGGDDGLRQRADPAQLRIELEFVRQVEARAQRPLIVRIVAQRGVVDADRISAAGLQPQVLVQPGDTGVQRPE